MTSQPPPFPDTGRISTGLGKLTPDVWDSFIWTAQWLHENVTTLNSVVRAAKREPIARRPWFLAKITGAKLFAANKYKYSWTKVTMDDWSGTAHLYTDDNSLTSYGTGGLSAYAEYAVNLVESANTSDYTNTGTDETDPTFPTTLHLQAIGGGYTDTVDEEVEYYIQPIVQMFIWRDANFKPRYFFSAANSYDGGCEEAEP